MSGSGPVNAYTQHNIQHIFAYTEKNYERNNTVYTIKVIRLQDAFCILIYCAASTNEFSVAGIYLVLS